MHPGICSRRHFLHANGYGLGTLALASLLEKEGLLAAPVKPESFGEVRYDLAPKKPHFEPRAKAMISLFMMGGPSQMDLFDPKPMLTKYHGQKFPGEVKYDDAAGASREGDKVVVDRSITPRHGHIVIAVVDREYTLKRLHHSAQRIELHPENPDFQPIRLTPGQQLEIWGVVVGAVRRYRV